MEYGPAPESDAEARAWLARHGSRFGHFVNGAFTKASTTFDVIDPSTTALLAKVSQGSAKDVDAAVAAARKAFPKWSKLSAHARARHLYALARMVQKHSRLFAVVESLDNGKPIAFSSTVDVPLSAMWVRYMAGWPTKLPGRSIAPALQPAGSHHA
ncbi:MAG: aldehyde dehydrogenase family protein, partial [Gemmatimonadetes bacterium]|nr:aldehyde dehydrogenase family protein [Gemmatimonadota bacterium]